MRGKFDYHNPLAFHTLFFAYDNPKDGTHSQAKKKCFSISSRHGRWRTGSAPATKRLRGGLDLASIATVHKHISALQTKNYLTRSHNQSRSVEVAQKYIVEQRRNKVQQSMEVPVWGTIAAGTPVVPFEDKSTISFGDFVGQKDTYALRVRGDSMIDDHICEDDMILVENTQDARDGDIVVALVGGSDTTLKRFYREPGNVVRLQPANASMSPIRVPANEVEIQGPSCWRYYENIEDDRAGVYCLLT